VRIPRIPKSVKFLPGFEVPVRPGENEGASGIFMPTKEGGPYIEIDPNDPLWERWKTYGHEIIHAAIDAQLWIELNIVEPLKAEAERTARELEGEE
jgi:hypothetical protein